MHLVRIVLTYVLAVVIATVVAQPVLAQPRQAGSPPPPPKPIRHAPQPAPENPNDELVKKCPMPGWRYSMRIVGGGASADWAMSVELWRLANACRNPRSVTCRQKRKSCEAQFERWKAGDPILGDKDSIHDNGPFLDDINGVWLGQRFMAGFSRSGDHGFWSTNGGCDGETEEQLRKFSNKWELLSDGHWSVANTWEEWFAWAIKVTHECRQGVREENAKRAEEERRKQEEARKLEEQRRVEEERRREEQRRIEEQRKRDELAQQKKREEEQKRAKEAQKRRDGSRTTGGTGVVDERTRRQQRIAKGFDDLRRTQETNRNLGNNLAGAAGAVFLQGGGETPSPFSTRLVQLEFGFGGRFWPVMTDTSGSVQASSGRDGSGGFSIDLGVQYWPIYRPRYGAGVVLHAAAAGTAMPGGGMYGAEVGGGIHGYLGRRTGTTLRAEADVTARTVGHSSNLIGAVSTGSGAYRVLRLGVGVRRCLSKERKAKEHCASYVGGGILRDATTISDVDAALVFRAELAGRMRLGLIGLVVELSPSYPAPGDTSYTLEEGRHGFHIAFLLRKAWTWY